MLEHDEPYPSPKYWGKYKGYVRENNDPERRGRIRCFCPQVMGPKDDTQHWLHWAEPCFPWLGGLNTLDSGPPLTKQENDGVEVGVWLEFEDGNPDFPIWVGTWLPAPTPTDPRAQLDLSAADGITGGSFVENPTPGSEVAALNPVKPLPGTREVRLTAKAGIDIVIGSKDGGYIVIGPHGTSVCGPQVIANGKLIDASQETGVIG